MPEGTAAFDAKPTSRNVRSGGGTRAPDGFGLLSVEVDCSAAIGSHSGLDALRPTRGLVKALIAAPVAVVVVVIVLLFVVWLDHWRSTELLPPTGPYPVGRTNLIWSDQERDTRAPGPDEQRKVVAWIWYPATRPSDTSAYAEYLPATLRQALREHSGLFQRDLSRVQGHSFQDADVSAGQRTYPVVLLRGGHTALVAAYTTLAEDLASHGYVVAGLDAPYRTFVVVLPGRGAIERTVDNNVERVSGQAAVDRATELVGAWSADMRFAVDQLERLNASDAAGRFSGRLDLSRLGAFGHSLGGAEALQFCHDDPRCKAGVDIDGAPFNSVVDEGLSQPFLFLMSDHAGEVDPEERWIRANFTALFNRLAPEHTERLMIRGASHFGFADDTKSPIAVGLVDLVARKIDPRRQLSISRECVRTFFDIHLQGARKNTLCNSQQYPEIVANWMGVDQP